MYFIYKAKKLKSYNFYEGPMMMKTSIYAETANDSEIHEQSKL